MRNRLEKESSPYLRQHADNPVDWYPWGTEALERARAEDRPILLSVGYSACHWCHVMAHESFEDPTTAALMNKSYVCIKVDREERPDLDQLYQGVVQLMGRGGGWPLTVFLTPSRVPFYGGTYFPPAARYGMPAFSQVLEALSDAWQSQRAEVLKQAEDFRAGLTKLSTHVFERDVAPTAPTAEDIVASARRLAVATDRVNGGFGGAPKFPNPMDVALLFRGYRRGGGKQLLDAGLLTVTRMAQGGIYDQLGGGFHRYSVDESWSVPHFEKMLYDNAQLLHLYSEAQQLMPDALWKKTVEETAAYVARELRSPEGGFYTAQDADSEGEEGKFFAWTPAEIRAVLPGAAAERLIQHFGVTEVGNFEHGKSTLMVKEDVKALEAADLGALNASRQQLFLARETRVKPGLDDKVLTGWNGLMVRGLAFAGQTFARADWVALAQGAADFLLARMRKPDGTLLRVFHDGVAKGEAFLEDYGDLAVGLLALYQATFRPRYLEAAEQLCQKAQALFWDEAQQAYLTAAKGQSELPVQSYALHDNAYPSGASTLTEAHVTLTALTGRPAYLEAAHRYLAQTRAAMVENPMGFGHLLLAADSALEGAAAVMVVGSGSELLEIRRSVYAPTLAWSSVDPGAVPASMAAAAEGRGLVEGKAAAYYCRHFACERPITNAQELALRISAERPL